MAYIKRHIPGKVLSALKADDAYALRRMARSGARKSQLRRKENRIAQERARIEHEDFVAYFCEQQELAEQRYVHEMRELMHLDTAPLDPEETADLESA